MTASALARDLGVPDDDPARTALLGLARQLDWRSARRAAGRAEVAQIRAAELAAGRPWPPRIPGGAPGSTPRPRTVAPRPLVVANGLRTVAVGCAGAGCVRVARGRWRCPVCGSVTAVPTPVVGPRVAACDCVGPVVCAHPLGARQVPDPDRPESPGLLRGRHG